MKLVLTLCFVITEVSFEDTQFLEGIDLLLTCSIGTGSYSSVSLLRVNDDNPEDVLAVFNSDGSTDIR